MSKILRNLDTPAIKKNNDNNIMIIVLIIDDDDDDDISFSFDYVDYLYYWFCWSTTVCWSVAAEVRFNYQNIKLSYETQLLTIWINLQQRKQIIVEQ